MCRPMAAETPRSLAKWSPPRPSCRRGAARGESAPLQLRRRQMDRRGQNAPLRLQRRQMDRRDGLQTLHPGRRRGGSRAAGAGVETPAPAPAPVMVEAPTVTAASTLLMPDTLLRYLF